MRDVAILAWLLLAFACRLAAAAEPDILGAAHALESGDYLYSELHFCNTDERACRVEYVSVQGELIARKDVDFSVNPRAPALTFSDYRRAMELQVDASTNPELVVDAGFDHFIRSRWDELVHGDPIAFSFLVVGREKPLSMLAVNRTNPECTASELCIEVELDSWLIGLFVKPIQLTYDRDTRRLVRFRGLSNIPDADGQAQQVDIRYRYRKPPVSG